MDKKKKRPGIKIFVAVFIIIFLCLYLYIYIFPSISNKFKDTYTIEYGTVSLGENANYLVFRNEAVINATNSGKVERLVSNGSLVRANTNIVNVSNNIYRNSKRSIISYYYDGYETVYSLDMLDTIKSTVVKDIEDNLLDSDGNRTELVKECKTQDISYGEPLYKVIYDNTWYICTWISKSTASDVKIGSKILVEIDGDSIEMNVYDMVEQGLETELILSSNNYFESFDRIRIGEARIITKSQTGLIIETDSIVTIDGVDGVYVINSTGKTTFVPIKILLKTEDKTIVSRNYFYNANGDYTYTVKIYDTVLRSK